MVPPRAPIKLALPLAADMLGVATSFTEQTALALGLGKPAALQLMLCTEEVFAYLSNHSLPHEYVHLEANFGGFYVELQMEMALSSLPVSAFNLTANPQMDDGEDLEQLGLLVASRLADRFELSLLEDRRARLTFRKEKDYPADMGPSPLRSEPLKAFRVVNPEPALGKVISRLVTGHYAPHQYPPAFASPGRLADMLTHGQYQAACATDVMGNIGGCLLWRALDQASVDVFGPYIFDQPLGRDMAASLMEDCLNRLARKNHCGLLNRYATPDLPTDYWELLGQVAHNAGEGQTSSVPIYYRQLDEDQGAPVWTHPLLADFLREQYDRLYLPRNLIVQAEAGETRPRNSLLGYRMNRATGWSYLFPMLDGEDFEANLVRHMKHLSEIDLTNLLFVLNLGRPWSVNLVPALFEHGFRPRVVFPLSGRSDVMFLQRSRENIS